MKSVSHIILGTLLASGTALAADIAFDQHDQDGDGFLSQEEWRDIDQTVVDFEQADANRDGRIDRDEVRIATQQSMEVSATQESDSGDEMEASVYSDSGQQVEAQRSAEQSVDEQQTDADLTSGEQSEIDYVADDTGDEETSAELTSGDQQAEAELTSSEQTDTDYTADEEADLQAGAELTAGDEGEIQRASDESESMDEREPVRTEPLVQSETERTSAEQSADAEMAAQQAGAEDQGGEEFREQLGQQDSQEGLAASDPMSDTPPESEVAPVRAGFDAAGEGLQVFEEADTDGDGRISESEARLAGHDYVAIYFDQMDVDGDGYLHQEEWDLTQREGMDTQNVSSEERIESMQGDDGEDLQYEEISHERVGEDEEATDEEDTDFEQ